MKKIPMAALYVFLALILFAVTGPCTVTAEESTTRGVLDIAPWSADGGGGAAVGGTFAIVAAVGQHETGMAYACGRVFDGGVWSSSVDLQPLFCDNFESAGTGSWSNVNPIAGQTDDSQPPGGE